MSNENNKRIAKNTVMLYFRMLVTMGITLYTSRIILRELGVSDFGIYNVVGGIVAMFSFLNSSMSSATQRFLSFELGCKDDNKLTDVFSMSITIHVIIALLILILSESVGLWFLNSELNILPERIEAANWVFQFSVFSLVISVLSVPYFAAIISYERMDVFAYISILEVGLKLLVVFILHYGSLDKLKLYALLLFFVTLLIKMTYIIYCRYTFNQCRYKFKWNKLLFLRMFSHSGWMLFGTSTNLLNTQGVNILINIFFGVIVNAARGIAYQLQAAVSAFVSSFMTAVQPQIIKLYAKNEKDEMYQLVFSSSKYSFFLLYFIALPVLIETETIIRWWLNIVPDHVVLFTRLTIIDLFFVALYPAIATISQATGNIKNYQMVIAAGFLLTFIFTYVAYRLGSPSYVAFVIMIWMSLIGLFTRMTVLKIQLKFPISEYISKVLYPILLVALFSFPIPLIVSLFIDQPMIEFVSVGFISVFFTGSFIWLVGLEPSEKVFLKSKYLILMKKF